MFVCVWGWGGYSVPVPLLCTALHCTALLDLTPHRDYPVPLGALGVDGVGWQILPRPLVADEGLPRGGALSTRD